MHTELFHAGEYLFLQLLLTIVPRKGQRSTPPFEVVHLPPCQESRTSNELAYLFLRITEFQQHITPHAFLTDDSERQVDAMQGKPVDLLFPTFPIPEGHGIREGTIVKGVTLRKIGLVSFLLSDSRKHGW